MKDKFLLMYGYSLIFNRLIIAVFPWLVPYCGSDIAWTACTAGEWFDYVFLDWLSPLLLLVPSCYVFLLNVFFVRWYSHGFLCVAGMGIGMGSIIFFPSNGDEILQEILAQALPALAHSWIALGIWILAYLILFGILFFITTVAYRMLGYLRGLGDRSGI